ncbi:MAG: diguanylate cyclase [Candidatus Izimaplasma sp.]|nr:diguanylate cyclase [Candidatus Izimaplasma bacterium]
MFFDVVIPFVTNIILLLSLSLIYSVYSIESKVPTYVRKIIMGIAVSIIGFIIMSYPYETIPGIFFDGRSIVMITSGMYLGTLPTIMGAITLTIYRIVIGGAGTIPGIIEVILPAIVGLIWRYKRLLNNKVKLNSITLLEQYIIILITQATVIAIGYLFPNQIPPQIINQLFIPIIIINPLGGLGISVFMLKNRINFFTTQEINENKIKYDTLFNNTSSAAFVYDPELKKFTDVNQTAITMYGYSYQEFLQIGIGDLNPLPSAEIDRLVAKALKNEQNYFTAKHITKQGNVISIETYSSAIKLAGKWVLFLSVNDISHRIEKQSQIEHMQLQLKTALASIHDGVILTDKYGDIELVNETAKTLINVQSSIIGKPVVHTIRFFFNNDTNLEKLIQQLSSERQSIQFKQITLIQENTNTNKYVDISLSPLENTAGDLSGIILILRDITVEKEQFEQIRFISQHDAVTKLYNRFFLEEEIKRLNTKRQLPLSFIIGDVNGLKLVNDAFGHHEGDNLLIEISSILSKAVRAEDILGRWGGDEFLILLPQTTHENAEIIVNRIRDLCQKSYYNTIIPSISLGIGTKKTLDESVDDVLLLAEKEMYAEKTKIGPIMRENTYQRLRETMDELNLDFKNHHQRCAELAEQFGTYLNRPQKEVKLLKKIAFNHDLGKISLDRNLLDVVYEDNDARSNMKLHVENGYRILNALPNYTDIANYVLHHHENYDGSGYPENLSGEQIPYLSRIMRLIEVYDSMTNDNNYGEAKSQEEALKLIKDDTGKKYDPELADAFIKMINQNS